MPQSPVMFQQSSLTETNRPRHYLRMRVLLGLLAAAALACAIGACAAIASLSPYTRSRIASRTTLATRASSRSHPDGTTPNTDGRTGDDDTGPGPADDGGVDAGCAAGLLSCDGSCEDPSATTSCGACDTACAGEAGLCASGDARHLWLRGKLPRTARRPIAMGRAPIRPATRRTAAVAAPASRAKQVEPASTPCIALRRAAWAAATRGSRAPTAAATLHGDRLPPARSVTATARRACVRRRAAASAPTTTNARAAKCVKVTRENDVSCGSNCTGSGGRDGFNCGLASPEHPLARRRRRVLVPE